MQQCKCDGVPIEELANELYFQARLKKEHSGAAGKPSLNRAIV